MTQIWKESDESIIMHFNGEEHVLSHEAAKCMIEDLCKIFRWDFKKGFVLRDRVADPYDEI